VEVTSNSFSLSNDVKILCEQYVKTEHLLCLALRILSIKCQYARLSSVLQMDREEARRKDLRVVVHSVR
jgi:hypothetical protein